MNPLDVVAAWVLIGIFGFTFFSGRRAPSPPPVRRGSELVSQRAAVDPKIVARIFTEPRTPTVEEQLRQAAGGRRP